MDDDFWKAVREKEQSSTASRRTGALNLALLFGTAVVALTLILTPMLADKSRSSVFASAPADFDTITTGSIPTARKRQTLYDPPQRPAGDARLGLRRSGVRLRDRLLRKLDVRQWRERSGMRILKAFLADARGATAVEYGLLAALISAALIGGLTTFGNSLQDIFNTVSNNLDNHQTLN